MEENNQMEKEMEQQIVMSHLTDISDPIKDSDFSSNDDICPQPLPQSNIEIDSLVINDSNVIHVGSTLMEIKQSENMTLVVNNFGEKSNSGEAQIIKDIQRNLKNDLISVKSSGKIVTFVYNTLLLGSLFIIISMFVFIFYSAGYKEITVKNWTAVGKLDNSSFCDGICIVGRREWGGVPVKYHNQCLSLNASKVRATVSHETCTNQKLCSVKVQGFQNRLKYDTLLPANDAIEYNFVIGGDERIYVGRGWDCGWKEYFNTAIIFNNYFHTMTERQIYLFLLLINTGRHCGMISADFSFTLKCDYNCHLYTDFEKAINLTKSNLYYVKNLEEFLEDSRKVSAGVCENSHTFCRNISLDGSGSGGLVECDFNS